MSDRTDKQPDEILDDYAFSGGIRGKYAAPISLASEAGGATQREMPPGSVSPLTDFIASPGLAGPFGALMDEYARAAAELCRVVEAIPPARFMEVVDSSGEFPTPQAICTHVVRAAYGHAGHIRKALGISIGERPRGEELVPESPDRLRPLLAAALRYTEATVAGLRADPAFAAEEVSSFLFPVNWGPVYDPEGMLEHGIVHLLRHRRQIERLLRA
jgi:hypothetical protein